MYTLLPYFAQALGLGVAAWIVREVYRRRFERRIATRYLYGGKRDRMMLMVRRRLAADRGGRRASSCCSRTARAPTACSR